MFCCKNNFSIIDYIRQKFGYQRENYGNTEKQKSLNQFDTAIYYPTNWRMNHKNFLGKMEMSPNMFLHSGLRVVPEFYNKNYYGIYPIKEQPLIDYAKPYDILRHN